MLKSFIKEMDEKETLLLQLDHPMTKEELRQFLCTNHANVPFSLIQRLIGEGNLIFMNGLYYSKNYLLERGWPLPEPVEGKNPFETVLSNIDDLNSQCNYAIQMMEAKRAKALRLDSQKKKLK